ncbi:Fic family protein [Leucothrix pacifica]|uniref:Cell filamentation protein Fic n=1 Tax=Leucothrix pacifica TaxID=1247513 RepID=A0A317C8M6_9GAMM|nr:Fic family protein [Leucothrix pacifica]PWQ92492.1 cell filamentation protein Fic [Leucothrix pacifica]
MNISSYLVQPTEALTNKLVKIDAAVEQIKQLQTEKPTMWGVIQQKLRAEWTFDSNAIEGSTLTLGETIFFLQEGLTVEGKPLKDFLDARNHAEAIDLLFDVVAQKRDISESLIKEINALLLVGVQSTPAIDSNGQRVNKPATPGQYKSQPNHVLQQDGSIHHYIEPLQVPLEMQQLCDWVNVSKDKYHPVIIAGVAHYNMVRIHPFDDGNGRGARILMNLILMMHAYTPVIVRNAKRRVYLQALSQADAGDMMPFLQFIAESMLDTQRMILNELGHSHS